MLRYLLLLFLLLHLHVLFGQDAGIRSRPPARVGVNVGTASHRHFPFEKGDYAYANHSIKFQYNRHWIQKRKLSYEILIEPSIYFANHQLLNQNYIQPGRGPDYLEQRERFIQPRSFTEYAINVGVLMRYPVAGGFSAYLLGSIGPMLATDDTERLKKGFAFSDILGLGFAYQPGKVAFDLRFTYRHNSNANLSKPNNGHDSVGLEAGVSVQLF